MGECAEGTLHHSCGDSAQPVPEDTHLIFSASNSLCGGRLNFFLLANQSFCGGKGAWVGRVKEEGLAARRDQAAPHPQAAACPQVPGSCGP